MSDPIFVSVGGGKGGIGKSTVAANLGATLSKKGRCVGFIDADLGGANLHSFLGVKCPLHGLQDFLAGRSESLENAACKTAFPNTWLISGASDILELADPKFSQKQRIISHLKNLKADFIFLDLGAGAGHHVTDFYASFQNGIIVSDGLPISIENAYGFLKNSALRGLCRLFPGNKELCRHIRLLSDRSGADSFSTMQEMLNAAAGVFPGETRIMKEWLSARKNFLVLNMVREEEDIRVGKRFVDMVRKYLSLSLYYIGYVAYAPEFRDSVRTQRPSALESPSIKACFDAIASNLISLTRG
jgi:flagellar biosynthesis protein FlhG